MHKPYTNKDLKQFNQNLLDQLNKKVDLVLLLQDVTDPYNVGSLFRTAECFGISRIILTQNTLKPHHPQVQMVARGLHKKVKWDYTENTLSAIDALRIEGYDIIACELTEKSVNYTDYKYSNKICLVLGNEADGVYKKVLDVSPTHVAIPMFGKHPSLNVAIAASVIASHIIYN